MIVQILGWVATLIFLVMPLPQIIKTIKTKTVEGVSAKMYVLFLIGNIIALIYAILITQPPLILKYTLSGLIAIFYLTIYWKVSKHDSIK